MKEKLCCDLMSDAVNKHYIVGYDPMMRDYDISSDKFSYTLDYCPWCATKLPTNLQTKWFDVIYEEYGIPYYDLDMDKFEKEHPEFATDEWWKKRGL